MYDKAGSVLRVEMVINNPEEFKVRKSVTRKRRKVMEWVPMRKGVAYLFATRKSPGKLQANFNRPASCGSFAQDPYCSSARMRLDPQFLKPNVFRGPLTGRFGFRLIF